MSSAPPALPTCSVCQTALDPNGTCPSCRAPEDWNDQIEGLDFIIRRLQEWHKDGRLADRQHKSFTEVLVRRREDMQRAAAAKLAFQADSTFPHRDECWSCNHYLYKSDSHCHECGAPIVHPGVKSLRYWRYLQNELEKAEEAGWLTLRQTHEFVADTQERVDGLQRKLERERAVMVIPISEVDEPKPQPRRRRRVREAEVVEPETPRRSFMEVLLDPQATRWLLAAGGALFVAGIVIWFASVGVFKEPLFVAIALGVGNVALLAGGYFLILKTRFQHAGLALTLLACLVMPLNLWFYHTNKLITLEDNLWIAALVCCIIYTASALVLKDPLFVYVLVGGVTLTGLLILAQMNHFGEVYAPSAMLVVLGLICLHAERAFPPFEGPFSRDRFGMAFFWSAQGLLGAGLLILLGAQLIGWLHAPIFRHVMANPPDVSLRENLPWTLLLVLAGTYAYVYSDLVVRKIGAYIYFAAITLLWAEVHILVLTDLAKMEAIVIITLALTALAVNVFQATFGPKYDFLRAIPPLGLLLSLLPVAYGILLHFRAVNFALQQVWPFEITWFHVAAMAVTALCCRVGAYLYRHTWRDVSFIYFFATAAATLVFAAGLAWMIGLKPWETEAPFLMVIPILYVIASHFYRDQPEEQPLLWCGHLATVVMLVSSLWAAVMPSVVEHVTGPVYNLLLAAFCLEATLFYALAGVLYRSQASLYMAAVMFCGAVWQLLISLNMPNEFYPVAFALTGFVLLIIYRVGIFEKLEMPTLDRAVFQASNALTTLGFVAGALLALSRFLRPEDAAGVWREHIRMVLYVLVFLTVISLLSAWLVQHPVWRRVHLVLSIVNGILLILILHKLSVLSPWQKLELFSIALGVLLLAGAYVGWYRETERASDLVSIGFLFGSIALVAPLLIAIITYRFQHLYEPGWHDLGLVVCCVALFGSGVICRIKTTTLVGAGAMACYLLVIIIGLHRHLEDAWIIGIYLALGGALLFGTGLFLSIYRDRLLALPDKIRRREGLFRIFDWR